MLMFFSPVFFAGSTFDINWITEKHKAFTLNYTAKGREGKKEYIKFAKRGIAEVTDFSGNSFKKKFDV